MRELWNARDDLARRRDIAPHRILPNQILAELAKRKPRSRADVVNSSLFRSEARKRDVNTWWHAIEIAWRLDESALPERKFSERKIRSRPPTNGRVRILRPPSAGNYCAQLCWALLKASPSVKKSCSSRVHKS
ncbi:HRDC domain-containing protein [Trueperella pyogenes]|uniref:HRDC domain-containing protein n=1 Tax=Trueperella pyogenes TaxID=1661 RepID=UPI002115CCD8|nr:HRDC domain-containing protein [Trueperella pyogenes]